MLADTERVRELAEAIRRHLPENPTLALVLGSGLSAVREELRGTKKIDLDGLPHYPRPAVAGHRGELHYGTSGSRVFLVMTGRVHLYEGYHAVDVVRPVRAFSLLGVNTLILTNAAGSLRPDIHPGSLMVATDWFHLMGPRLILSPSHGESPLPGPSAALVELAERSAGELAIPLRRGTLVAMLGPSYETSAEVSLLRRLGGSAVTMSTLPEVMAARGERMRVMVLSVITNRATGTGPRLSHDEVTHEAGRAAGELARLLTAMVPRACGRLRR